MGTDTVHRSLTPQQSNVSLRSGVDRRAGHHRRRHARPASHPSARPRRRRCRDRSRRSSPRTVRPRAPGSSSGGPSRATCRWPRRTRSCCSTTSGRWSTVPGEAKGAPWHPHRGFETVSYILDGEIAHHDTNGGGGVIGEGDTQWMTAGGGILHDELPTERMYRSGGPSHAVQLWVNLPPALKMTTPRYQSITRDALRLLTSDDGGALIRLIAGDIAGFNGPGRHPHPDHLRPRHAGPRRAALGPVESRVQRVGLRPDRPRHRRAGGPTGRGRPTRRVRPRRPSRRRRGRPPGRAARRAAARRACRSARRSPTTDRS